MEPHAKGVPQPFELGCAGWCPQEKGRCAVLCPVLGEGLPGNRTCDGGRCIEHLSPVGCPLRRASTLTAVFSRGVWVGHEGTSSEDSLTRPGSQGSFGGPFVSLGLALWLGTALCGPGARHRLFVVFSLSFVISDGAL